VHGPRGVRKTFCDDGNDDWFQYRGPFPPGQEQNADGSENLYIEITYISRFSPLFFLAGNDHNLFLDATT
jgi:hypothetical protein